MADPSGASELGDGRFGFDLASMLPQRLDREHLAKIIESGEAKPWHLVSWYAGLAKTDPDAGLTGLEALLADHPRNIAAMTAILDIHIFSANEPAIEASLARIEALDVEVPYWLHRFRDVFRTGVISMGDVTLRLDRAVIEPIILRHFATGGYEIGEAMVAAELVADGDRVLELGAAVGYVAICALRARSGVTWRA